MSAQKYITLNDGNKIPQLGLGTWLSKPGEVKQAVIDAVKTGYRHLDLARIYQNEHEVGEALKELIPSVVKREDLFITGKLWNHSHAPEKVEHAYDVTLKDVGVEKLDLWLIHWPVAFKYEGDDKFFPKDAEDKIALDTETTLVDTWKAMIELQKKGRVTSIGVSNFTQPMLEGIIKATGVVPAVNQIEAHPVLPQDDLVEYSKSKNIHITAYSPLGNPAFYLGGKVKIIDAPQVLEVAKKNNADCGQVLIAYGIKKGQSVIPKSVTKSRIESNFKQIELSDEDFKKVSSVLTEYAGEPIRFNTPQGYDPAWGIKVFEEKIEADCKHKVNIGA